jgi:N-acetylglutamate synthase
MDDLQLIRRVEECAFSSWPALQQIVDDGWILRFADGHSKRANSANPTYPGTGAVEPKIARVEAAYRRRNLPIIFRLTPLAAPEDLDRLLADRSYRRLDPSRVLILPDLAMLDRPGIPAGFSLVQAHRPTALWLAAFDRIQPVAPAKRKAFEAILRAIAAPACFMSLFDDAEPAAILLGVVTDGRLGIYDVATAPMYRGAGLMRALLGELGAWALGAGADSSQLFVLAGNAPAERLYQDLGWRELYRYHYRVLA